MKKIVAFFFTVVSFMCSGQMIDNLQGHAFTETPFFHVDFIAKNKIKSIKGRYNYKKSGQAMFATDFYCEYRFNERGQLTSFYETKTDDGTTDTTWMLYQYDDRNRLTHFKQGQRNGLLVTENIYNDQDQLVKMKKYSEFTDTNGILRIISHTEETYEHVALESSAWVKKFNSYNLPFMDSYTYKDSLGYLNRIENRLKMTGKVLTTRYHYDDKGLLGAIKYEQFGKDEPLEEFRYKYDDLDNVVEKHVYKEGVFLTDMQMIYNSKSQLLTAHLVRDVKSDFIMIIRFQDYTFYD